MAQSQRNNGFDQQGKSTILPRFAANLTTLYCEVPFLERFALAAEAGFKAVECQFPYQADAGDIASALQANDLQLVLHNMPAGDWQAGERGVGALFGRQDEFRSGVTRAIDYATALDCRQINCLSGIAPAGADLGELRQCFLENLRYAANRLGEAGIRLLIEPINSRDVPGFFLDSVELAAEILDDVGSDNLFIQYDLYHRQRSGGELIETFKTFRKRIAHIQIADTPGRHEPGTGEINFANIFAALDRAGYDGWIGCEYFPKAGTADGLGWLTGYQQA